MKHHNLKTPVTSTRVCGFSLIELMITVAVIGILASIAYPSFTDSIQKSRRSDAKSALLEASNRQELFFSNFNRYTTVVVPASGCAGADCGLGYDSANSPEGYYTISVTAADNNSFTLTATREAGTTQENDNKCGNFTLSNTGSQGVSGSMTADRCW